MDYETYYKKYYEALDFVWNNSHKFGTDEVLAGILLSLYNGKVYPINLNALHILQSDRRTAVNTVICGFDGDETLHLYIIKKFGQDAWDSFLKENKWRREK